MAKKNALDWIALVLVIIGAVNWGLVGAANMDLVDLILGTVPWLAKTVYILVGLAGLYMIYIAMKK
ncbi:DUF378 domain-containing protein [Candidatus Pacearchaeota archaeon]|nr:DUF378 domain-containing protein [Candidatus Pacearchaeota archaeon]MBD3283654.1 DUF378 domain-containing protein [Candidatus Pacearchaeota archaeon]